MKLAKLLVFTICLAQLSVAQDIFNKGKAALTAKDTAAAIVAFQDALKAGQKAGDCNYYLGAIALRQNRIDDAVNYLAKAVNINDENVEALIALGDAYIVKKDNANAVAQYKRATKIAPKDCRVPAAYGAALLATDSVDAAIIQLFKAKDCNPNDAGIYVSLGDAYIKQGVIPLANANYEKALELSPRDIETQMKVARAYVKVRDYNNAIKAFESAVKIDSMNFDAYFEAGRIIFRAKQYKRAVPFLYRAVNLKPRHVEATSIYAQALSNSEIWGEGAKAGAVAVKLDSANVDNWRAYMRALVETQDYKTALVAFSALERRKAVKPEDFAYISTALFRVGQEDKALEFGLKAIQADSANCDPYFNLGFIYMKKQDYTNASRMFEKKIACDPRSLTAYVNAGSCYMQAPKNLPRARELFLKAVELKPDFLQAKLWLARYYAEVDSSDLMKITYDEVIKLGTENPEKFRREMCEAYTQLGSYYFTRKNFNAAIEGFRKAAASGCETAALNLAWGQGIILTRGDNPDENRKKTEEAITKFRRCIQMEPGNAQGHFWLANSLTYLRKEGDTEGNRKLNAEACAEYAKALKYDPKLDDAKKGMERIGCK
jgi:tetratricopeptide (TPR) repeat protein